jgi:predicted porin
LIIYFNKEKILMKKVLLALTLAVAGVASAQVGIYGRVGTYLDNTKTGTSTVQGMANDLSHFGIRATENLGGGLTARATYETYIQANSPETSTTAFGDRQSTVGIAHKMGSVDLGRSVHTHFLAVSNNDPFGTLIGSSAADVHNLRGLRLSNAAFTSVNFGNVSANFDRSTGAVGTAADPYAASLVAAVGPAVLTYARYEAGAETSDVLAARAKFGATTVYGIASDNKGVTANTNRGQLIGAAHNLGGPVTVKASYGRIENGIKSYNVGAEYAFSKRTYAQVLYRNVEGTSAATDIKQVAGGLVVQF